MGVGLGGRYCSYCIQLFIEDKAFSPLYDLAPPPPPIPLSSYVLPVELTDGSGAGGGAR